MHLPYRSEWRLAMWNGFLSGAQSSSRALAMSSSNLFLNIFSINILNYTNPKLYWNFKVYWTRLAMVTLSKSSWRGCRRPKPQHSQQRPWVKWVKVVDRLPKASGLLNLTRMMSPVNSGSKSSVEPGWTFPVEKHLYRQEITDQTPGKGEFEAMPRSAISCSFTPSISLHATLDHILLWTLPWPPTGDKCCIFQPEDRLSPRRISPQILQQERPASAYPVCLFPSTDWWFVFNNRQQCNDNYRDCVPSDLKPFDIKLSWTFLSPSCHQLKGGEVAEEGNRLPVQCRSLCRSLFSCSRGLSLLYLVRVAE